MADEALESSRKAFVALQGLRNQDAQGEEANSRHQRRINIIHRRIAMIATALGGAGVLSTLAGWHVSSSAKDEVKRATIALLRMVHKAEMQNKTSVDESIEELSRRAGKGKLHSKSIKKALKDLPLSKGTEVTMRKDRVFVTRKPDTETLAQLLERLSKKRLEAKRRVLYLQKMHPWIGGTKVSSQNA